MKKNLLGAILILVSGCIANAQIKVVGDDYVETLSGSKSYYDNDVDFDSIFPAISPQKHHGFITPFLDDVDGYNLLNLIGDTVFITDNVKGLPVLDNNLYRIHARRPVSFACQKDSLIEMVPSGYYTITGYVFCAENAKELLLRVGLVDEAKGTEESGFTMRELKEAILHGKDNIIRKSLFYIVLTSLDGTINYYDDAQYSRNHVSNNIILLRYYNDVKKRYLGKSVINFYHDGFENRWKKKNVGSIEEDALRKEEFRLQDSVFVFNDIVLKDGIFYCILFGEKTGSYALELGRLTDTELFHSADGDIFGDHYIQTLEEYFAEKDRERLSEQQREQEERQRKRLAELEHARNKKAFEQRMIEKYGPQNGNLVARKQVAIGMTKEMCRDAWGRPMNTYRTTTQYGQSEVWCYNYKTKVYFYNGNVVQIDD